MAEYQGAAAVYLNENDWTKLFSQYQYDAILTKSNGDVITCSNSSFLSQKNANKYLPADAAQYVRVNGNRYLRSSRSLENGTVLAYSFIYSPTNYSYLFRGAAPDRTAGTELGGNVRPHHARYD